MSIAVITGSGTYALAGFEVLEALTVQTPFGPAAVARGSYAGVDVLHVSRHGAGHAALSNHVSHRANIWALKQLGASAAIGCTACGAVDPTLPLGSLIVFDDLYFTSNRLADGSLCTFFIEPGDPARGHWILSGSPFSAGVREALLSAGERPDLIVQDGGVYGHVDGPRFNTPAEIAELATRGVVAVSQTGGPETVLCGELELPFALIGFVTDYANEVRPGETTPVAELIKLMSRSGVAFAAALDDALPRLGSRVPAAAGTVYRFESG